MDMRGRRVDFFFRARSFESGYWRPGHNYVEAIFNLVKGSLREGDIIAVSEKALSTALGNVVDEAKVNPSVMAKFLASFWTRVIWGYFLGFLCHMNQETIRLLRDYPSFEGSRHKQVALTYSGFLSALNWGSEGGIDGSNLPYSLVSLPLRKARKIADKIRRALCERLGLKKLAVIIIDTDKTYSFANLHLSPRRTEVDGIHGGLGFLAYVFGRMFRLRARPTPVAVSGARICSEHALRIARLAERVMGHGAGRNVWEMAENFGVGLGEVSWEMLESVRHRPVAIVRLSRRPRRMPRPSQ